MAFEVTFHRIAPYRGPDGQSTLIRGDRIAPAATLAIDGTVRSLAIPQGSKLVRIVVSADCRVELGPVDAASASSEFWPAGCIDTVPVDGATHVSVVAN